MVLVERASGVATWVFHLDEQARIVSSHRNDLPYRPMVRPLLLPAEDGAFDIYGIGGQGPVLSVLRFAADGSLTNVHSTIAKTARGFASDHHPVLLTKGGTLELVVPGKTTRPVSSPGEFPGKGCGAIPIDPSDGSRGLLLTWVPLSGRGIQVSTCVPGTTPVPMLLDRKIPLGQLDTSICGRGAWAVFTRPDEDNPQKMAAWGMALPDGKPVQLLQRPERAARAVQMVPNPTIPVAVVTWDDGSASVVKLSAKGGDVLWSV
jgi:hypothetical protein